METYGGFNFVRPVTIDVDLVAPGVGKMTCLECEGDPIGYAKLFPPELGITGCIDCKGRGWVFVSI